MGQPQKRYGWGSKDVSTRPIAASPARGGSCKLRQGRRGTEGMAFGGWQIVDVCHPSPPRTPPALGLSRRTDRTCMLWKWDGGTHGLALRPSSLDRVLALHRQGVAALHPAGWSPGRPVRASSRQQSGHKTGRIRTCSRGHAHGRNRASAAAAHHAAPIAVKLVCSLLPSPGPGAPEPAAVVCCGAKRGGAEWSAACAAPPA